MLKLFLVIVLPSHLSRCSAAKSRDSRTARTRSCARSTFDFVLLGLNLITRMIEAASEIRWTHKWNNRVVLHVDGTTPSALCQPSSHCEYFSTSEICIRGASCDLWALGLRKLMVSAYSGVRGKASVRGPRTRLSALVRSSGRRSGGRRLLPIQGGSDDSQSLRLCGGFNARCRPGRGGRRAATAHRARPNCGQPTGAIAG